MKSILSLGEIMLRLCPSSGLRLTQSIPGGLDSTFAGAEANVAVTIAQLDGKAAFVSALPDNQLSHACIANLRSTGVDTSNILLRAEGRFSIFFLEAGVDMRGGQVIYDRENSSFVLTPCEEYPWADIFSNAAHLHTSGITPAASANTAALTLYALKAAKDAGLTSSYDINHRRKLWRWDSSCPPDELATKTHLQHLPFIDILIGNPCDLASLLKNPPPRQQLNPGETGMGQFEQLAKQLADEFPHLKYIAVTLRQTHSASENSFGALLYSQETKKCFLSPVSNKGAFTPHRIESIVDRVGTGDAFTGALLRALYSPDLSAPQMALDYAVAAATLAHTVRGDYPYLTHKEVLALALGCSTPHLSR